MSEFNNRVDAQRSILLSLNHAGWKEELYGLSAGAIDRWLAANAVDRGSELARLLFELGAKLFFLAHKSQEQVTEDYRSRTEEVHRLAQRIPDLLDAQRASYQLPVSVRATRSR